MTLKWENAMNDDEPRDQNADTALLPHGYWSLGPEDRKRWSVVLIEQDCHLDEIRYWRWDFSSEASAKAYAEKVEAGKIPLRANA